MYSSNNAGVVGNRVILGTLKARKQNYSGAKWRLSCNVYWHLIHWKVSPWHRNVSTFEECEILNGILKVPTKLITMHGAVLPVKTLCFLSWKTTKSFCRQRVGFEISRERQGLLLQSRKTAKRWQRSWKTRWNYRGIEFHEFVSERSKLFRPRSSQARDEVTRGPAPYKNRMKYCFESLL